MHRLPARLAALGSPIFIGVVACSGASDDLRAEVVSPEPPGPDAGETTTVSDAGGTTTATDANVAPNLASDARAAPGDATDRDARDADDVGDASRADDATVPSAVSFATVFTTILDPRCSTCHGGPDAIAGMDFTSKSSAYSALVGVPAGGAGSACGASGMVRVLPGSSARSLLYLKVSGTEPCGVRMPASGGPLTDAEIQTIEDWIDQGASDD